MAAVVPEVMPDPFRRHGATEGLIWLTTPLVQLATELADQAGTQLVAKEAWLSSERSRPLDTPATRLADARQELMEDPAPEAAVALSVLKEGYAAATAWLAPLPPAALVNSPPMMVSPGLGIRAILMIMSVLELPTTRIRGFMTSAAGSTDGDNNQRSPRQ